MRRRQVPVHRDVCAGCGRTIRSGVKIAVAPPEYERLLGINEMKYFHKKCAKERGLFSELEKAQEIIECQNCGRFGPRSIDCPCGA